MVSQGVTREERQSLLAQAATNLRSTRHKNGAGGAVSKRQLIGTSSFIKRKGAQQHITFLHILEGQSIYLRTQTVKRQRYEERPSLDFGFVLRYISKEINPEGAQEHIPEIHSGTHLKSEHHRVGVWEGRGV